MMQSCCQSAITASFWDILQHSVTNGRYLSDKMHNCDEWLVRVMDLSYLCHTDE